jgi:hypothetical protein
MVNFKEDDDAINQSINDFSTPMVWGNLNLYIFQKVDIQIEETRV